MPLQIAKSAGKTVKKSEKNDVPAESPEGLTFSEVNEQIDGVIERIESIEETNSGIEEVLREICKRLNIELADGE